MFAALAAPAAGAWAQDTSADTSNRDRIVVTGSRLRRSNASAAIPVQILDRAALDEIGSVDVGEMLTEIPGVDASLSPESTSLSTQNSGLSTINLRRLGGNRTLTLIDGRRAVSNSGNGERVSLNTIPSGFVQSVEVTTGGASAIYGSDAIAGVANIIFVDDFEGISFNIRRSEAEASGEEEFTLDFTAGRNFANGRGNILVGFTYDDETAIFADSTRPDSVRNVEFNAPAAGNAAGFGDETNFGSCDASGRYCINPSGSSNLIGGLFEGDDAWNIGGVWFNDQSLLPADGRTTSEDFEADVDGYNFRPGRTLSPSIEIFSAALKSEFEITPRTNVFVDLLYSQVDTLSRNAALAALSTTDIGFNNAVGDIGTMSSSHPFIPPEVEETRSGSVSWRRRFAEVGTRDRVNDRETLRTAFGFEGTAFDDWEWSLYATYGRYEQNQMYLNELHYLKIQSALDIESDGAGGFQCDDAAARADGCVPLNIFGEGSVSEAAASYIRYTGYLNQVREQTTFAGNINGELFQLPAGPVLSAFGFEYRKEEQRTDGDADNIDELTSMTPIPDIEAEFAVTEGFVELDIPLIRDQLSLQLAARFADYDTVGSVLSYNVGGSWAPTQDLRFRAQYSRSQRAPTITEFFSPPRGDFDSLLDPCDGLMSDGTGLTLPAGFDTPDHDIATLRANCQSETGIQAFFNDPVNAGQAFEFDGSVSGPNAGNTGLAEETADTFTVGAIFTPSVVPGLSVIVDYYNIAVEDAIGSVSTQLTADLCYTSTDFPNNRFCNVISRDASSGVVSQVINQQENLDEITREGVDVTVNYDFEAPLVPGDMDLNFIYTQYLVDELVFLGQGGLPTTDDSLGEIGSPEREFRMRLGWEHQALRLSYSVRYKDGGVDNLDVASTDNAFFEIDGQAYHNIYVRYAFGEGERYSVYGGVNNIFDEFGPFLPTGLDNGGSRNIVSSLNDVEGREFYVGLRARW